MGDIGDTIRKFKRLNFIKIITKILNTSRARKYVVFLEKERLFHLGEDSNGESLGEYHPVTVVIKQEKRQRTDHITLLDTGSFYKSFTFHATGTDLVFDANPIKVDEFGEESNLFDDFGIDVLGLNDADTEKLIEWIYVELRRYLISEIWEAN